MSTDYVFLCVVMWAQYASEDGPLGTGSGAALRRSRRGISRQRYSRKRFNSAQHKVRTLKKNARDGHYDCPDLSACGGKGAK